MAHYLPSSFSNRVDQSLDARSRFTLAAKPVRQTIALIIGMSRSRGPKISDRCWSYRYRMPAAIGIYPDTSAN
jgi:hypothetical protein